MTPGRPRREAGPIPAFGGTDEDPSPLLYALGTLSSCGQITGSIVARDLGLTLGAWTFAVQGDLDPSVLVGGAEGNANFERVAVDITVESDASAEGFAEFIRETERRCPVTQLFRRSGLQYETSWEQAALPVSG